MILLNEILENPETGTYIAVKFSEKSCKRLIEFAKNIGLDNIIPIEKIHTTLIYSRKPIGKKFKTKGDFKDPQLVQPLELDLFGKDKNSLVLKLSAPELIRRHKYLMNKYDLTYDFDEYVPHVTLSYEVIDFKIPKNIDFSPLKDLEIVNEYMEDLKIGLG